MSEPTKPESTLKIAMKDEQGQASSVRVAGLIQVGLTVLLALIGAWAAYGNHKDLVAYIEKIAPWSSGSGALTLLWGQLKSAFVLGNQAKAKQPQENTPA